MSLADLIYKDTGYRTGIIPRETYDGTLATSLSQGTLRIKKGYTSEWEEISLSIEGQRGSPNKAWKELERISAIGNVPLTRKYEVVSLGIPPTGMWDNILHACTVNVRAEEAPCCDLKRRKHEAAVAETKEYECRHAGQTMTVRRLEHEGGEGVYSSGVARRINDALDEGHPHYGEMYDRSTQPAPGDDTLGFNSLANKKEWYFGFTGHDQYLAWFKPWVLPLLAAEGIELVEYEVPGQHYRASEYQVIFVMSSATEVSRCTLLNENEKIIDV